MIATRDVAFIYDLARAFLNDVEGQILGIIYLTPLRELSTFRLNEGQVANHTLERLAAFVDAVGGDRVSEVLGVFEMEPIGVGGAFEAVSSHPFCSESCRASYISENGNLAILKAGSHEVTVDGLVCEQCAGPLGDQS